MWITCPKILNTYELGEINQHSSGIECLLAQQHALLWTEDKYLEISSGQNNKPLTIIYDEHAEGLSFPSIYKYLGQARTLKTNVKVTPFIKAPSEIRHKCGRGVTPHTHTHTDRHTHVSNINPGNKGSPILFVMITLRN
jgi:hypothetical protein